MMTKNGTSYYLEFHNLFDNHSDIMLLIDPDNGNIVYANIAAITYYGYTKESLMKLSMGHINTLSQDQITEEMYLAKKENRNYFQFVHRLANGELREVEVHSSPIKIENVELLFSIIYDISNKSNQKLMYDSLFFDSPYGVAILDENQKIININKNFTNLFQYALEEINGQAINHLVSPLENRAQIDENIQLVYQGKVVKQEGVRKRKDGELIDVEILGYPVINQQSIIGVYIIYIDISNKKTYEKQLLLFKKILEENSEGVVITDVYGNIGWTNSAFKEITGYTFGEISGRNMNILKSGIQDEDFYKEMWSQLEANGKWKGEIWNKDKKGDIFSEWLAINSIKNNSDKITDYVGVFKDLSEKKRIDRRMNDLQQKDTLTGLYNRDYFLEIVDTHINRCKVENMAFSIIFIDLAGFKEINDSLGHNVGDKLLIELSTRLLRLMNEDYILSRFSGDEFVILCKSNTYITDIYRFAKALMDSVKYPILIDDTLLYITANIGISNFPECGNDAETLVRYADIAMSKAKNQQDKICIYHDEMSREVESKFLLSNHLVGAISNNELTVHYQPIFDINNGTTIMGAEALLRWKNPTLGMVPPDIFIPLAEKTGQIIIIGEWVLDQVFNQMDLWQRNGYKPIPIAVNISVKQLEQIDFCKVVIKVMNKYNIEPKFIELEITESVSSGDIITIVKNLKELKQTGIKISMDDFGTGFSSLGQLDLFELDKLKIDKVFIDDLVNVLKRQNLVKSIIAMAKSLDLIVVAEGIETKEQLSYLKKLGCQLGQGYLFSKPLQAKEIERLFDDTK